MRGLAPVLSLSAGSAFAAELLADARDIARWLTSSGRDVSGGRIGPMKPRKPAQTPCMQGLGIGLWLLRLHAFEKGERPGIILPDSAFPP
jgi:hypothetical protein